MSSESSLIRRALPKPSFFGWRVVWAAFVVAVFGWGVGFYGPPVYLYAVQESRGWSVTLVSSAVTTHFLAGAFVIANLPALHRRFGLERITTAGTVSLAVGVIGWAVAREPVHLFAATLLSGAGWATTGAAAINAMVSPWFHSRRPAALSLAYNGASVGGILFSPLWVVAIATLGFPGAAAAIGIVMIATLWFLSHRYFATTPEELGVAPDGESAATAEPARHTANGVLPGFLLWRNWRFITLAGGMALGLFAQIGLIAHLFSLLVPALGAYRAGLAAGLATASAIAGRTLVGWLLPPTADRRMVAALNHGLQICGGIAFMVAGGANVPFLLLGVVLFGAGIGNATSLPPLIAQVEFAKADVPRIVALITAISQAAYAFAPAAFGALRHLDEVAAGQPAGNALAFFIAAAAIQSAAAASYLAGRRLSSPPRGTKPDT